MVMEDQGKGRVGKKDGEFRDKKKKRRLNSNYKNKKQEADKKKPHRGPRLPNTLQKQVNLLNSVGEEGNLSAGEGSHSDYPFGSDIYEYVEATAEEESRKNRRFDPVENYEFELPDNFEDWEVDSDESEHDEDKHEDGSNDQGGDARHTRMLEGITGLPSVTFAGKKKKDVVVSETYPESEYNPSGDILDGDGKLSIDELVDQLHGKPGFSELRKRLHQMEKKSAPTLTPLPKVDKERLERIATYDHSKKDITKWEPLVKRNREAPTLYFDEELDVGFSSIGAIASGFEPRTKLEKGIASLVSKKEVVEAHMKDGSTLLEMNKMSLEDVKERQDRLAKMRSLLFLHEVKAKRIKKIKSKTYHRILKKDRKKAAEAAIQMDPKAAKELARNLELKRAEERMTLKHKNHSRWAKRILHRGLSVQDESTREAFGEQLEQHAALTRKINSLKESSSDESSDDDSDTISGASDQDFESKLLSKAKQKTLKVLEEDAELPKSGVLALPFMKRGLQKKQEELALAELEDEGLSATTEKRGSSGRRVFGAPKQVIKEARDNAKSNNFYGDSESENDEPQDENLPEHTQSDKSLRGSDIDPNILREEFEINHNSLIETFGGSKDPEPKETYEVAYLGADSWKKVGRSSDATKLPDDNQNSLNSSAAAGDDDLDIQENEDNSDTDSAEEEMVDGILSSGPRPSSYVLPSQEELIKRAFAGDDVEEDFKKDKEAVLDEENPEPEKLVLLPGWGQWTNVQKRQGLPSWMLQEHEMAKKKRLESMKKRKDARLNNVIISEKVDKKAEKLLTKTLPYPFTSSEVFEQSIRMPIGPEFNPATAVGPLNRPEVVKRSGVIIKPISYEDVSVGEKAEPKRQKQTNGKKRKQPAKLAAVKA